MIPPLKIASCIKMVSDEPVIMEPLPLLLSALFLCLKKVGVSSILSIFLIMAIVRQVMSHASRIYIFICHPKK